ncbi:MAG: hypothetical protein Q8R37_01160 [Nanoarchaeota archaeon]|nr:hypothetical protein [Nanoarchaeota archaeon]
MISTVLYFGITWYVQKRLNNDEIGNLIASAAMIIGLDLKIKLKEEGFEMYDKIVQLKMPAEAMVWIVERMREIIK